MGGQLYKGAKRDAAARVRTMGESNGFGTGHKAAEHISLLDGGSVSLLAQLRLAADGSIRGRHLHSRARAAWI